MTLVTLLTCVKLSEVRSSGLFTGARAAHGSSRQCTRRAGQDGDSNDEDDDDEDGDDDEQGSDAVPHRPGRQSARQLEPRRPARHQPETRGRGRHVRAARARGGGGGARAEAEEVQVEQLPG